MKPSRRELTRKILRKLVLPRELASYIEFKFVSGNEYPYFDFSEYMPWLSRLLNSLSPSRLDYGKPVFVAGLRRSGTTMFYRLMNANSQLFMYNERFPGDRLNGRSVATPQNIFSLDDMVLFRRTVSRFISPLVRTRYARWGVKLALELAHPDPGSISVPDMRKIIDAFPAARVIGIVRDPRDFVLSALRRGGHDAQWWIDEYRTMMDIFSELNNEKPGAFRFIQYESLVRDPGAVITSCCEFADLPFEPKMLDSSKWSVKGPKEYESSGIVAHTDKWRAVSGEEKAIAERVTSACFPDAQVFGYVQD